MRIDASQWYYSPDHGQLCRIIETHTLWGETTCRVWLPGPDKVVRVSVDKLKSLDEGNVGTSDYLSYISFPIQYYVVHLEEA